MKVSCMAHYKSNRWVAVSAALLIAVLMASMPEAAWAQQKIGYIDSDYLLEQTAEYETIQEKIDQMAAQWRSELEQKREQVKEMKAEYQAREVLYTEEERVRRQKEIRQAEQEIQQLRAQYFGPQGELFSQQKELMRPLQERILTAVEAVATRQGYDYVFDKSGEFLFMYVSDQHNLNEAVLQELGIDIESTQSGG